MQKIKTLYLRDKDNPKRVTDEPDPDCLWVFAGEGVATDKIDGTCCAVFASIFYRRHVHKAEKGEPPNGWLHWSLNPNQQSGHGWLPVSICSPADRWHIEGLQQTGAIHQGSDFTYELVGPKVQRNPYRLEKHELWRHGGTVFEDEGPRDLDSILKMLKVAGEGIVWHHPDGRMAKIKRRDYGFSWPKR